MSASTALSAVVKMLDHCAPGYTIRLANHSRVIIFADKVYRTFPKHDPVENGHVRKLVRFFGIENCASPFLPGAIKHVPQSGPSIPAASLPSKEPKRTGGTKQKKKH